MASAGDRLQIVLAAKDEISSELKQVKAEMTSLGRTARSLQDRIEAGEQGLQQEYEQTRRALERNRLKQIELGRAASKAKSEIRQMTSDGTAGMKRMDRATDGANRSMSRSKSAAATLTTGWGKMVGAVAVATGAIASLSGAFRFLSSSINEAREQRKAAAQLGAVMKSMGRTEAPDAIMRLVDQLTRMSGIEDDEILASVNLMLTFGEVTGKVFNQAETAAVDLAAAFHMDLQSATVMVGKALNNPIGGLTSLMRVGVAFTEKQKEKIKTLMEEGKLLQAQKVIMGELTRQVSGSAAAQADAIDKMRVAWKDLQQAIGEALMSSAPGWDLTAAIEDATKWIIQNQGEIREALLSIAGAALRTGQYFLVMAANTANAIAGLLTVMEPLFWAMKHSGIPGLVQLGNALSGSGEKSENAANSMFTAADAAAELADKTFGARDKVQDLNDALEQIKNKKLRIEIRATVTDMQTTVQDAVDAANAAVRKANRRAENNVDAWAMGGPVTAGQTGWVGEIGPELFVPTIGSPRIIGADGPEIRDFHQSGTVIPNHLLATVTLPKQATPAGYIGPPVTIGTINAGSDVDVEKAVLRATLRADRIARERR